MLLFCGTGQALRGQAAHAGRGAAVGGQLRQAARPAPSRSGANAANDRA